MKKSRTSTSKNNKVKSKNNIRKNSTSPASTKPKNIQKKKQKVNTKKKISNQNTKKKVQKQNVQKVQKTNVKSKNVPNPKVQNTRIKKVQVTRDVEDDDIIHFNPEVEREYMNALENGESIERKNAVKRENLPQKKEEKKRRIKPTTILKFSFLIAVIISIGYVMFTFEVFNLENIKVEGNEKYTEKEVIDASSLAIGKNVFKQLINTKAFNLPYVSEYDYSYSFPNTIVIKIKERYPTYLVKDNNTEKYYKLDNEGYILEECGLDSRNEELLVEGFVFEEQVQMGQKIDEVYLYKIDIYRSIKEQLQINQIQGNITKVNFANSLTIITLDDKLNIVFANDSNIQYKVSFLKGIIEQNGGMVEGTIDMSIDNPVYSKYD